MEPLVQSFLENVIDLCLRRLSRFPIPLREPFEKWAVRLRGAFASSRLANTVASALEKLRASSRDLAESLEAELLAVVALQDYVLRSAQDSNGDASQTNAGKAIPRSVTQDHNRALGASKSLLGSWREALGHLLPDWAKGLIKVGEELIEIYGPAR
jgi:hypothetical protein